MKGVTRRDFLRYCGLSAAAVGLSMGDLGRLEKVLASTTGPVVVWVQGGSCTGCSESFLNRISSASPQTAVDVLVSSINLVYHPTLMALAGETAAHQALAAYNNGGYILAVEGGVPTAFGGAACWAWTDNGVEVTFQKVVTDLASKAAKIISVGTCASWGGIPAAAPNPAGIKGVQAATGKSTINVAGCPPHPDWIVGTIAKLLLGQTVAVDANGRPSDFFARTVHSQCPRREGGETSTFGQDNRCLKEVGCRGPSTRANCPQLKWNAGVNWCVDANAPCLGCTEPGFPGTSAFYRSGG